MVPRYFLHMRYINGGEHLAVDEEGDELSDASALRRHVEDTIRDLINHTPIRGINWYECTFEVTDEAGQLVLTLPFSEAPR
jgi:hypothetical protein